jgi:adenosylhomocysteine nucleosidase
MERTKEIPGNNKDCSQRSAEADSAASPKKRIGLVVAIELEAIFRHYKNVKELDSPAGFKLYSVEEKDYDVYILRTGMGEIAAASGVQYLISKWNVSTIVNYGVVGGLTAEMKKHKLCVVDRVVHYKYDCSEFLDLAIGQVVGHDSIFLKPSEKLVEFACSALEDTTLATCCSGDKFISTETEKQYLHETFEGDICDMESAGIVLCCELNDVPCLLIKAVSDGLSGGAEEFYVELESASLKCLIALDSIMEHLVKIEH